jgi:hypothetical protein
MKTISTEDLTAMGYTEDKSQLRRFERTYAPYSILGVAAFFGGFYFVAHESRNLGITLILGGFLTVVVASLHCARAIPNALGSGTKMERYRRLALDPYSFEYVYVDDASKTYFTRWAGDFYRTGLFKKKSNKAEMATPRKPSD